MSIGLHPEKDNCRWAILNGFRWRAPPDPGDAESGCSAVISEKTRKIRAVIPREKGFSLRVYPVLHLYAGAMQKAVAAARLSDYIGALGQRCSLRLAV